MNKIQSQQGRAGRGVASALVDDWQTARRRLRAIEQANHPDITDALGRVWVWADHELYRHDSMAWTKAMVTAPGIALPTAYALSNPNYQWCDICRGGTA